MPIARTIKGTRDILPDEMPKWHAVEDAARHVFSLYGFEEIRTPIFEETELFVRSIGAATDIVEKEMYTFKDKSDHSLTLRPEMTAPVVRSYIEHHMEQAQQLVKLYYLGPMFRYERPQKGRYRQFYQIGAEVLGSDNPAIEAEVLEMLHLLLSRLGIKNTQLLINSIGDAKCRPGYLGVLRAAVAEKQEALCGDCRRRMGTNVLRVLDCKVESCQETINSLPSIADHLCQECDAHFRDFRRFLDLKGIEYHVTPRLVRGLDYYVRTTFEITSPALGAQNALLGGGRYDGLAEILGGPPTKGFGFALGLDRFVLALPSESAAAYQNRAQVMVIALGQETWEAALRLTQKLRAKGVRCHLDFESRSLKSQLRQADRLGLSRALILGPDELREGKLQLKNLSDHTQQQLTEEEALSVLAPEQTFSH